GCVFASRRGDGRLVSDWSSDVCSSDLELDAEAAQDHGGEEGPRVCCTAHLLEHDGELDQPKAGSALLLGEGEAEPAELGHLAPRSEERRVGKGCRTGGRRSQ